MSEPFFISYSAVDGKDLSLRLADDLAAGPPPIPVWLDKRDLRPGEDWDEQLVEALRACRAVVFLMTPDSVRADSGCKDEWVRALQYKKPIVPLLASRDADVPYRLASREYIDFAGPYDPALARLRKHLAWLDSPNGRLRALEHRLGDAQRDLPRAEPSRRPRIEEEIAFLTDEIARHRAALGDPGAAERRQQQSIDRGLERERTPTEPKPAAASRKFINPPPLVAPTWFQDRHVETRLIADFLRDDALRLMTVVGRGGIGKSAMVCRLLRALEGGQLPDDGGPLAVDGIVYLSDARSFHRVSVPDLFDGLVRLLPEEAQRAIKAVYQNPQVDTRETMRALLEAFPRGRTVVLLDNFENAVDVESGRIREAELDEALRAVLELPPHGLKLLVTTRVAPRELALVEPGRQRRLDLDTGLDHPFAEYVLRAMDADGKVGLRDAPDELLATARQRTRGYPRALEHLFGILSADRDTSLAEILDNTIQLLPEKVVQVLVGEAFSRLDATAQRVMQALATYRYPVPAPAVDFLLQPYGPGVDSAPVLRRLVNMQFARRDQGRYHLHQTDRDYAESRIAEGSAADRDADPPPWTRFALQRRAAEWFRLARKPREAWKTIADLDAQLLEFELRVAGGDHDTAATVLLEIDFAYLVLWGHYRLVTELHERLRDRVADPALASQCIHNLGLAYLRLGDYAGAQRCFDRALTLARERGDRAMEGVCLGNLGALYADRGDPMKSIQFIEAALPIRREVRDRLGESIDYGNLANRYAEIGRDAEAIDYYEQALAIDRELADRPNEAHDMSNLGVSLCDVGRVGEGIPMLERALALATEIGHRLIEAASSHHLGEAYSASGRKADAVSAFRHAVEVADELANPPYQQSARMNLALEHLDAGDLPDARHSAQEGLKYSYPPNDASMNVVAGIVALRAGDRAAAAEAFRRALTLARAMLERSPRFVAALDNQGIALCGLALCGDAAQAPAAMDAFRAARAISSAAGTVRRVLRVFDALAAADERGARLAAVRPCIAGGSSAC